MEKIFNEKALYKKLRNLKYWKQLAFLTSVCQRLLPNFLIFARKTNYIHENQLEKALEVALKYLEEGTTQVNLEKNEKACERIAPNTEDFDTILVSSALDATIAVSLLMKAFSKNDTSIIVEAISLINDTIDMYVQEIENLNSQDDKLEEKILSHTLMQKELQRQNKDIEFLLKLTNNQIKEMPLVKEKLLSTMISCLEIN